MSPLTKSLSIDGALGALTMGLFYALVTLFSSPMIESLVELLTVPGALVAILFWPDGVHSSSAAGFLFLAITANLVFYSVLWHFARKGWSREA